MNLSSYSANGYFLWKQFFPREQVARILTDAQHVFRVQLLRHGYIESDDTSTAAFEQGMVRLFQNHLVDFMNCGKHAQHLISLHRLSLDPRIEAVLQDLGLERPSVCTRPVLFFNHPDLAKKEVYWRVSAHQDWRSMQGSLDAVVVWLPLTDIGRDLGALEIVPGSHLKGLLTARVEDSFGMVDAYADADFVPVETQLGDVLFFSSFLVHRSGTNTSSSIRWSCHFRYNNLSEPTFVERGYPHPYLYKPQDELLTPDFPSPEQVGKTFTERRT